MERMKGDIVKKIEDMDNEERIIKSIGIERNKGMEGFLKKLKKLKKRSGDIERLKVGEGNNKVIEEDLEKEKDIVKNRILLGRKWRKVIDGGDRKRIGKILEKGRWMERENKGKNIRKKGKIIGKRRKMSNL